MATKFISFCQYLCF